MSGKTTIWQQNSFESLNGLGDSNAIQTAQSITVLAQNVANKIGAKPTNDTLNAISGIAAQAAGIAAAFGPAGAPIAGILAVVSGAAQVLSSVFAGGPSSAEMLQQTTGQNAALLVQIDAIDKQTDQVTSALVKLKQALNQNGFKGLSGIGSWYNEVASSTINQSITPALQDQLAQKGKNLQALIEIFNATITDTYNAIYTKKNGQTLVFAGLLLLALGGVAYVTISSLNDSEK